MESSFVLLQLAGNIALLLWGLYMVQTGIIRAFGTELRRFLGTALRNRFRSAGAGVFATMLIQSSTAVGLMVASFTASKMVGLVPALAVMLGANVGSTLLVQLFSFKISHMAPVIILIGFIIFKRSSRTNVRDFARFVIGVGIMLLSLEMMIELLRPAEHAESLKLLLSTISQDHLLDMIFGAVLTWLTHSSAAVVLLGMSFAGQGLIPIDVAFALVLGANLGSAINPLIETDSKGNPANHRLPFGNLINRAVGCLIFLPLLELTNMVPSEYTEDSAHAIAGFHTLFNIAMAILFFPLLPLVARLLQKLLPDRVTEVDLSAPLYLSKESVDKPSLAIANASREALRMADLAEKMLRGVLELLSMDDRKRISEINKMDDVMDKLNQQIKNYVTTLDNKNIGEQDQKRVGEILAFVTNFEHIGDAISEGLVKLGAKKIERKAAFSSEGWEELRIMMGQVIDNIRLASAVFMTRDLRTAKQLMNEKGVIRDMEIAATESHFKRLKEGRRESMETSTLHLDIVRDLKRINSHLTATAIPVLEESGQLLKSRLKAE